MKKVIRIVWISALSGLAFLAACCTTKGGISKAERKQLIKERDSIQDILTRREGETVYGSPEIIAGYGAETMRLRYELDSINQRLGEDVNLEESKAKYEKSKLRSQLMQRLVELQTIIQNREGACVYGSPEIIQEYGRETERLRQEADSLRQEIDALNKQSNSISPEEIEALPNRKPEGRAADVLYGSPDPNRK